MDMDQRTYKSFQQPQKIDNTLTLFRTIQLKKREHLNNGCKQKEIGSYTLAKTKSRKLKTDWIRKHVFIGYGKEVRHK